jgi:hypothetical protein
MYSAIILEIRGGLMREVELHLYLLNNMCSVREVMGLKEKKRLISDAISLFV